MNWAGVQPASSPGSCLDSMTTPQHILRRSFGYSEFREHQLEIIETLIGGGDAFVLMPTGSGKSICYQIPAILRKGVGVVVSPLIALMQDQVGALRHNGLQADFLNSGQSAEEAGEVKRRVLAGRSDLLYVAPERLLTESFLSLLGRVPLALFAIDEAHCVSQWGHDFRPEYLQIRQVADRFPGVPRIALTATADRVTRREIVEKLGLGAARQFVSSFDRPNIRYRVQLKEGEKGQLLSFIRGEHEGHSGIVYCRTRNRSDEAAEFLAQKGLDAVSYHAGLDPGLRALRQRRFLEGDALIVVATIAFGMGIDKPDVRFVAHLDLPMSMEAYYQETGRAGRDGQAADAWMVYSMGDVVALRQLLDRSEGAEPFKSIQQQKLGALLGYCESTDCRRRVLLGYFGESLAAPCGNCDVCLDGVDAWDGTVAAQKALSCVYRTGQRFGANYLADVLTGRMDERMQRLGHDRIKTFGVGQELTPAEWRAVFRQLIAAGLLDVDLAQRAGFRLNERSWEILRGERAVSFRKDRRPEVKPRVPAAAGKPVEIDLDGEDGRLFERLRDLRLRIARRSGVPPYVIFHDKTLKEMAALRPSTRGGLLQITGVGESKLEKYGEQFLEVINGD